MVKLLRVGFVKVEVKPDGPLHEYVVGVAVPVILEKRFTVPPTQAGLLFDGAVANEFIVTTTVAEQPAPIA